MKRVKMTWWKVDRGNLLCTRCGERDQATLVGMMLDDVTKYMRMFEKQHRGCKAESE